MELYLDLLNAIVCYSSLPVDALVPFVTTLCHTLNVERFCEKSWQVSSSFMYGWFFTECSIRVFSLYKHSTFFLLKILAIQYILSVLLKCFV